MELQLPEPKPAQSYFYIAVVVSVVAGGAAAAVLCQLYMLFTELRHMLYDIFVMYTTKP